MLDFRQSTAATVVVGPILDSTGAEYTSAVIGDLSISKNGGTLTAMAAAATLTHIANGQYTLVMTTGNLDTLGRFQITCNKSTYQMPERAGMVMPASVWDALYANATNATGGLPTATGSISAFAGAISTFAGGAVSSVTGNVGGNVVGSVGSVTGAVVLDSAARVTLAASQPDYDLPTNTELNAALAASDDATLAAIAAEAVKTTAIQAKTDNLPADPASATLVGAVADAVLEDTDNIKNRLPSALVNGFISSVLGDTAHGGEAATLFLSTIEVHPSSANAAGVTIRGDGSGAAVDIKGGEYADGIKARSGDSSGYGICSNGVQGGARFWSTNGYGVYVYSDNSSAFRAYAGAFAFEVYSSNNCFDVYSQNGNAVYLQSQQNDAVVVYPGSNDIGVHIWGGQTSGDAVALSSNGSGSVVYPTSGGGGGGGPAYSAAVVVARLPVGSAAGWPQEIVCGSAYLTALGTHVPLYVKDVDDTILAELGEKNFTDGDFKAILRLSPLTDANKLLAQPAATIEVDSDDTPGIVFNNDTAGEEYFELQIPKAKTALGEIRTRYLCQLILRWGDGSTYEWIINLGESKFIRGVTAAP